MRVSERFLYFICNRNVAIGQQTVIDAAAICISLNSIASTFPEALFLDVSGWSRASCGKSA